MSSTPDATKALFLFRFSSRFQFFEGPVGAGLRASGGRALATLLSIGLVTLFAADIARAQLPVGGYLGEAPIEEEVEDQVEEQVEDQVGEDLEDQIEDSLEMVVENDLEDSLEGAIEDTVEQATEQNIQENIEDNIEDTIEQTVDATVEDTIDDTVAQSIEAQMEDSVEAALESEISASVEESVEENVEENVAAGVEETIEENLEESVAQTVESSVEDVVVDSLEASVESSVEDAVEGEVIAAVEEGVESTVEEQLQSDVEASVEDSIEVAVEDTLEASVEDDLNDSIEASVEAAVETGIEEGVEDALAQSLEDEVESSVEGAVESSVEEDVEQRTVASIEERLENEIDEILDDLESDLEVDERRILKEQWLVMAEPAVFDELSSQGYLFDMVTDLPGLGLRLAEVAAPSTFDITQVRNGVLDVVGKDRAEVDLNHFYTAGVPEATVGSGVLPRSAMHFPADLDELDVRVGMIDSSVDTAHPALAASNIESRSFARAGAEAPDFHGTAIASIIAGNSPEYRGLAPNAHLYAASVFELDSKRGEIASTVSLIRALDWLMSSNVDVVNISLAGPPNRLLEKALERAAARDVVVMAAAGNGGPVARPMYPAAYTSVVAVTAVDASQQVFRLANRGDYLALAAPGVDLRHAQPGGGYAASSGTSFAVPFAVTAAARLSRLSPGADIISMLLNSAMDLGPPGRDQIYGYGLLTLGSI